MAVGLADIQQAFVGHLRDPDQCPPPQGIAPRPMALYRELVHNGIESLLAQGFPVLRAMVDDGYWRGLVTDFVREHRCETPYFYRVNREFVVYLNEERDPRQDDPPFLGELAHYEWIEHDVAIAPGDWRPASRQPDWQGDTLAMSPFARCLSYRFPVHLIGPDNQPAERPSSLTWLVVYRNAEEQVKFLEVNAVTARVLLLIAGGEGSGLQVISRIAREMNQSSDNLQAHGLELLNKLYAIGVIRTL